MTGFDEKWFICQSDDLWVFRGPLPPILSTIYLWNKNALLMSGLILAKLCCLLDEFIILYVDFTAESNSKAFDVRSENFGRLYIRIL